MIDSIKERLGFEELWLQGDGHFKYFKFSEEQGKYVPTGIRDNLTDQDLLCASITLNTAYLFYIGGVKKGKVQAVINHTQGIAELAIVVINSLTSFIESQDIDISEVECSIQSDECQPLGNKFSLLQLIDVVLDKLSLIKAESKEGL